MGVWGHRNFECDVARYQFSATVTPLLTEIIEAFKDRKLLEPDEYESAAVLCNMDMIVLLARLGGRKSPLSIADFPKSKRVEAWRKTYLKVWDGYIDELAPTEAFKRARREVIATTFDHFIALARHYETAA